MSLRHRLMAALAAATAAAAIAAPTAGAASTAAQRQDPPAPPGLLPNTPVGPTEPGVGAFPYPFLFPAGMMPFLTPGGAVIPMG